MQKIREADEQNCVDKNNAPLLTIIDYRTEHFLKTENPLLSVKSRCKTIKCLLDDLRNQEVREQIPKQGLVVLLCETGNRDALTMSYLSKYGYTNIVGLRFGMRAWIKADYPVISEK